MTSTKSYRQLNEELEVIITKLQEDDLDVDQIINHYQRGIEITSQLEKYLQTALNKISKVNQVKAKK